jgi:phosphoribosylformimino-5-aminoimidazole carboxamide ribotide isomerase
MQLIPAVDLLGSDATRLEQGDYSKELFRRPAVDFVARVAATRPPWLHLVDLDGARSGILRLELLADCVAAAGDVPVQVSGGVRSVRAAESLLEVGAKRVLIGTAAFESPQGLREFTAALGEALAVTIDVRDGLVNVRGWLEGTGLSVAEAAQRCVDAGVVRVMGTAIARDGTDTGPDLALYRDLVGFPMHLLAAGGVRNGDDVAALEAIGCEGAVTGRAFAEGRFDT